MPVSPTWQSVVLVTVSSLFSAAAGILESDSRTGTTWCRGSGIAAGRSVRGSSPHIVGRALQIYRDLSPDSQHPLPRIPDSCYQVQTDSRQQSSNLTIIPSQLPAPCTLSCLICVDIMQMLPPLTISTQYLHSIYTLHTMTHIAFLHLLPTLYISPAASRAEHSIVLTLTCDLDM